MNTSVLSVDVGGTKTLIGLIDHHGRITREHDHLTRVGGDDVNRVAELVAAAAAEVRPAVVAIGFPEYVDPQGRLTSHEVLAWTAQPSEVVADALAVKGLCPVPFIIESDVRLGALGEATFGAGRGTSSLLYVSLGTGLSSAFLIQGTIWTGNRGEAIGFGEFRAPEGSLEDYVSGAGIAARYEALTGQATTGREVAARAQGGEQVALKLLETAGEALGDAIADLAAVLDPERIIIGGGWGTADTPLMRTAHAVHTHRSRRRAYAAPLVQASLGHRSGLIGGGAAGIRALAQARSGS